MTAKRHFLPFFGDRVEIIPREPDGRLASEGVIAGVVDVDRGPVGVQKAAALGDNPLQNLGQGTVHRGH